MLSVGGAPSCGSRCTKSLIHAACAQACSSSRPSTVMDALRRRVARICLAGGASLVCRATEAASHTASKLKDFLSSEALADVPSLPEMPPVVGQNEVEVRAERQAQQA